MFFAMVNEPMEIFFHGEKYMVSPGANNNHRQCRDLLILDVFDKIRDKHLAEDWTMEELQTKRKELISKLKEWDKTYIQH